MPVAQDALVSLCLAAAAGVGLVILSGRIKVPSIVLLLVGGVALGPSGVGLIHPESLGRGLEVVIALAVAIILFEGGLTLDLAGYRRTSRVIKRLLTIGPMVTWLGTAAVVFILFAPGIGMALLAGSLVIVTGPTVIAPILRRIHIKERTHHVLFWESVLIDPIGVFVAVLCYEWLTPDQAETVFGPVGRFVLRVAVGVGIGVAVGLAMSSALQRSWVAEEHVNIFVLACALLTFGLAHGVLTESGILAVVAAGLVVGLRRPPRLKHVKQFKLELTEFGIGLAFVLLSARLDLARFGDWRLLALLAVVILGLRPAVIWIATWREPFTIREKALLSWIAPRGIVAAAMASLFTIRLQDVGYPQAVQLETITFAVIATTVTLQGLSAPWVVRLLGLHRRDRRGWVLLGDVLLVREVGRGLRRAGVSVVELTAGDPALDGEYLDEPRMSGVQALLCINEPTPHHVATVQRAADLADDACFQWTARTLDGEMAGGPLPMIGTTVWTDALSTDEVAHGLGSGALAIDVIEIGETEHAGYFGEDFQPLFWVSKSHAQIVPDPREPGPPEGDLAVVLRRRIPGLHDLVAHVDVVDEESPSFESVVRELMKSAQRLHPELPIDRLVDGILERQRTMPTAVGSGVAIPHAYCEGLERSRCFVANVTHGIRMTTPDREAVHIVFLVLSPQGGAGQHLNSLAALATLTQDTEFLSLMTRQRVPERLARMIVERG